MSYETGAALEQENAFIKVKNKMGEEKSRLRSLFKKKVII